MSGHSRNRRKISDHNELMSDLEWLWKPSSDMMFQEAPKPDVCQWQTDHYKYFILIKWAPFPKITSQSSEHKKSNMYRVSKELPFIFRYSNVQECSGLLWPHFRLINNYIRKPEPMPKSPFVLYCIHYCSNPVEEIHSVVYCRVTVRFQWVAQFVLMLQTNVTLVYIDSKVRYFFCWLHFLLQCICERFCICF